MTRRNFLLYSAMLGMTLPFTPKAVKVVQRKWKKMGKISIERVEYIPNRTNRDRSINSSIGDDEYFPYEEYVAWTQNDPASESWGVYRYSSWRQSFSSWALTDKQWREWLDNRNSCTQHKVYEDEIPIGMLILGKKFGRSYTDCIQFKSYILDELINVESVGNSYQIGDHTKVERKVNDALANPLPVAIGCAKMAREKARGVLERIIKHYEG